MDQPLKDIEKYGDLPKFAYGLWGICVLCLSLSLYAALNASSMHNLSLLCYGSALVCLLQIGPFVRNLLEIVKKKDRIGFKVWSFSLLAFLFFFIYVTMVSASATFLLFPNPYLHKILAFHIYGMGMLMSILGCGYLYVLLKRIELPSQFRYEKSREARISCLLRWREKARKISEKAKGEPSLMEYLRKADKKLSFPVDVVGLLLHRMGQMALWMCIPLWIFVAIPLKTFPSLSLVSQGFLLGMLATIVFTAGWIFWIFYSNVKSCCLSERGLIWRTFFQEKRLAWHDVSMACVLGDKIVFQKENGRNDSFRMAGLKNFKDFWNELHEFLPLDILFISEEGWVFLKEKLKEEFDGFAKKYHQACAKTSDTETGKNRKTKK